MQFQSLFFIVVIYFAWVLPSAGAADFTLKQTQEGIRFQARNQPLSTVLKEIGEKSGIAFFMKEELYETPVSADMHALDWKSLVKALLKDLSKVEMWTEDTVGSKVRITGLGEYVPPFPGAVAGLKSPTVITVPKAESTSSRWTSIPRLENFERPEPSKSAEELHPNHPLAKLPQHVFMEPAIMNYLLESGVDIPIIYKRKYGLPTSNEEKSKYRKRRSLPIPNEIYNDPKFDEYLKTVGLKKPPQIPPGFKKLKPGEILKP